MDVDELVGALVELGASVERADEPAGTLVEPGTLVERADEPEAFVEPLSDEL